MIPIGDYMQIEIEYRLRRIRKEKGERNPRVKTLCAIAAALDAKFAKRFAVHVMGQQSRIES